MARGRRLCRRAKREVTITELQPIGHYAVQPLFSDGHTQRHLFVGVPVRNRRPSGAACGASTWRSLEAAGASRDPRAAPDALCRARAAASCGHCMSHPTTHFGFTEVDEIGKARRVAGVFDSVASKYDLMNDVMSAGLHRLWKAFTVRHANVRAGMKVLDIAGGTGDLASAFAKRAGATGEVWLTDINGVDAGRRPRSLAR